MEEEIRLEPLQKFSNVQHRTNFLSKKIILDLNLATRFQFFDPDDPARYQLYAKLDAHYLLPKSWILKGTYDKNIVQNFDESTRISDSVLTRVRTDIVRYLTLGKSGLDSLYFENRGNDCMSQSLISTRSQNLLIRL